MNTLIKRGLALVLAMVLCIGLASGVTVFAEEAAATIDLTNKDNRVSLTGLQQVWTQNGITVTNNKSESTTDVADYAPVRLYQSSELVVAYSGMKQIVFTCNNYRGTYASALETSINNDSDANVTVSVDGKVVTVVFAEAVDSFTVSKLSAQVRLDSIRVSTSVNEGGEEETPVIPADPAADSVLTVAEVIALGSSKDHNVYTEGKYYVTGVITEVYNTQYGNMKITDEAGNILTIYGTFDADGTNRYDAMTTKPVAGDTVKIYGIVGQYYGTPQIKNGWIVEHTPGETETPVEPPVETEDPAADSQLTIAEAIELGLSKEHDVYTEGKYYVTGVITEVYNTQYGNMKITDEAGNILTIYGTFDADGTNRYDAMTTKPVAGDTVKIYGIVGQYNDVAQIKNGWIVEHTPGETETPVVPPVETEDPAADSQLTIAEAIALGSSKEHNVYTEAKYYVTGVITEVYNTIYGNMKLTDEAGNILTIYGTYSADGETRYDEMEVQPVAGDTVTIYGIVGQYNGTPQIKNGWIVENVPTDTPVVPETPVEPETPAEPETPNAPVYRPVTGAAPAAGDYLLGMYQGNLGKTLYFAGTTANTDYYLSTTENIAEATVVTVEEVTGGYRLSFMDGGVKKYIDIYQNGDYVNLRLTEEPTAVYTWNNDYKTFQTVVGETEYYMGTYKEYSTLSASKLSYAETSFPAQIYESSPNTGDNMAIYFAVALLFVSAGAVLTLGKKAAHC